MARCSEHWQSLPYLMAMGQELMDRKVKFTFSASPSKYPLLVCHIPTEFHALDVVHIVKMKIKTVILGWLGHIYNLSPSFIVS